MYAIVDIETTGKLASYGRIIEIAIILHDGKKELLNYSTLINPEEKLSRDISLLTGICDEDLKGAPTFKETAEVVLHLLRGCTFVAHNVNFDLQYIRQEFHRMGISFLVKNKLCTIQLSRELFPGLSSYSLGSLCTDLGIPLNLRHRAFGDAKATSILFSKLVLKGLHKIRKHRQTFTPTLSLWA